MSQKRKYLILQMLSMWVFLYTFSSGTTLLKYFIGPLIFRPKKSLFVHLGGLFLIPSTVFFSENAEKVLEIS